MDKAVTIDIIECYFKRNGIAIYKDKSVIMDKLSELIENFNLNEILLIINKEMNNLFTVAHVSWYSRKSNSFKYLTVSDVIKSERTYRIKELLN
jgi:hypothetical protein